MISFSQMRKLRSLWVFYCPEGRGIRAQILKQTSLWRLMPGRVLGSDKNYISSEEGSRDPRKGSWVTVQASLRKGVFYIQQASSCNTCSPPQHTLSSQGKPFPLLEERK